MPKNVKTKISEKDGFQNIDIQIKGRVEVVGFARSPDGQNRVVSSENCVMAGGSQAEHEKAIEAVAKFEESISSSSRSIREMSREEVKERFGEAAERAGMKK